MSVHLPSSWRHTACTSSISLASPHSSPSKTTHPDVLLTPRYGESVDPDDAGDGDGGTWFCNGKLFLINSFGFGLTLNPYYKSSAHPAIILQMYLLILFYTNPSSSNMNCQTTFILVHWKFINNVYRLHCHQWASLSISWSRITLKSVSRDPVFGGSPYPVQYGGCGVPGLQVRLPLDSLVQGENFSSQLGENISRSFLDYISSQLAINPTILTMGSNVDSYPFQVILITITFSCGHPHPPPHHHHHQHHHDHYNC